MTIQVMMIMRQMSMTMMIQKKRMVREERGNEREDRSRKLLFLRIVPTFTVQCREWKLAEFGK
jgi:hypothetical protein